MNYLLLLFWLCLGLVVYTFLGYPAILAMASRIKPRPRRLAPFQGSVSIILAVRNEEANLERRLRELIQMLNASRLQGEIILVSDGSNDGTVAIAQAYAQDPQVRLLELAEGGGKAAALSAGAAAAHYDILVFADARQTWAPGALTCLLENFAEPAVGAVSGDLVLESAPGVLSGVGLYWRFEKWLRKKESQLYAQIGVTGAISAVRRGLFKPIPAHTVLDDVYWPLQVALQGQRVVHDERAQAYDRLPDHPGDEFRRKIRTLAGNFQLVTRLPQVLVPWRNPVWWQLLSHKLLRLAVPWLLLGLLVSSWFLPGWTRGLFWVQVGAYCLALLGLAGPINRRSRLAAAAGSFLVLNTAAWLGFWVWLSGRTSGSWRKVVYTMPVQQASAVNLAPLPSSKSLTHA